MYEFHKNPRKVKEKKWHVAVILNNKEQCGYQTKPVTANSETWRVAQVKFSGLSYCSSSKMRDKIDPLY